MHVKASNAGGSQVAVVVARAPTRIDFGGGWTDVPPYSTEQGGCVCNVAIARYATAALSSRVRGIEESDADALTKAALRRRGARDLHVRTHSDFPYGAGLGGSSAAGVAITGALAVWCDETFDRVGLAERSRALEVDELGIAGGRQDHYAAALGGALGLWFGQRVRVQRIPLTAEMKSSIEQQCIVAYTGQSRISGENIIAVLRAYRAGEPRVIRALARMRELAEQMIPVLERGALDELGALVGEHWVHQRALHPAITTPGIEAVLDAARAAGAIGGKALGASGGGCVLAIAPAERAEEVRRAVQRVASPLDFTVDVGGLMVTRE